MPYWGDSLVANSIDYRKDTPLQCTIDGAAVAQCIIFGLFGVNAAFNGDVIFNPHLPPFAPKMSLEGLKVRGVSFDVLADGDEFSVTAGKQTVRAKAGTPIRWRANERLLKPAAE
jgi:hypothetical protein